MAANTIKSLSKSKKYAAMRAIAVTLLLSAGIYFVWMHFAPSSVIMSTGSIQRSWSDSVVAEGNNVDLTLKLTPGEPTDAVVVRVNIDPQQLKYDSVSYEGSPFTTQAPAVVREDSVTIMVLIMGGESVRKDAHIARLTFEAKTSHSPSARIYGNSALAGIAHNPYVEGMGLRDRLVSAPLLMRAVVSLLLALILTVLTIAFYRWISKKRGQGRNHARK